MGEDLVLKPKYLENFQCTGRKCKDSCFLHKEIFLNKDEYDEYKKLDIEGIKFEDIVGKLGKNRTDDRYAKVRVRKWIEISILDYLRLINLELGYRKIPEDYKYSPIYINSINGALEEIGNLACPEIVRLILKNKNGIELINEELTDLEKSIIYQELVTLGSENVIMKYFWDIRMYSLNLLMSQSLSLKEKIISLNIFYEHIGMLNNLDDLDLVPDKVKELDKYFSMKDYKRFFNLLPDNEYIMLDIIKYILDRGIYMFKDSSYRDEIELSLNGYLPRMDFVDLRTIYLENKKIYDKWYWENSYVLESYFINNFLKEVIPYSKENTIKENYSRLVVDYVFLRILLIGTAVYTGRLEEDLLIDKIFKYERFKIENPEFLESLAAYFKVNNYMSTEYLSTIL